MPPRAIKAIFFTRFHHSKGSRVLHQVPSGSITASPTSSSSSSPSTSAPLFDFDSVSTYIIPTQQFCDRLITFCTNHHRVIGYPVCVREGKYSRNEYIFNFAVVVDEAVKDWAAYGEVVRKLGRLLRGLEELGGFLSREEEGVVGDDAGSGGAVAWVDGEGRGSKVYALCEVVLEDLNNYAECMIPIDESNTINLKLFPAHPPPPPVHSYQVPLLTISINSLTSPISSDLTLIRIIPFIDGVNSVSRIAQLADTDLSLTCKALQHLAYYGCLVLLDIFQFGAIYAPTADIGAFVTERSVQEECARYVRRPRTKPASNTVHPSTESSHTRSERSSRSSDLPRSMNTNSQHHNSDFEISRHPDSNTDDDASDISPVTLIMLYTSLRQGLTLHQWVLENLPLLHNIDIRRFITFGIIKGILYRVHRYAISTSTSTSTAGPSGVPPAPPTSLQSESTTTATTPKPEKNAQLKESDSSSSSAVEERLNQSHTAANATTPLPIRTTIQHHHNHNHKPSLAFASSAVGTPLNTPNHNNPTPTTDPLVPIASGIGNAKDNTLPLVRFLDGMHCFDEICTEVGVGVRGVEERVRGLGDCVGFWR